MNLRTVVSPGRYPAVLLAALLTLSIPVAAEQKQPAVHIDNFAKVSATYYRGAQPMGQDYVDLAALGVKTVINLNTAKEGAEAEGKGIMAAGLDYVSIPVATLAPDSNDVAAFSRYVNDPKYYPILVHCESSNRVGAMWAIYRATNGVPPEIAVQEGRTVGLKPSREVAVREILKLPPLPK